MEKIKPLISPMQKCLTSYIVIRKNRGSRSHMALSLLTRIIRHRLEAGGLAQRVEVIFAAGLPPFQSLTVAGLLGRRLTPDALPLVR